VISAFDPEVIAIKVMLEYFQTSTDGNPSVALLWSLLPSSSSHNPVHKDFETLIHKDPCALPHSTAHTQAGSSTGRGQGSTQAHTGRRQHTAQQGTGGAQQHSMHSTGGAGSAGAAGVGRAGGAAGAGARDRGSRQYRGRGQAGGGQHRGTAQCRGPGGCRLCCC